MALLVKIFEIGTNQEFQSCNKLFDETINLFAFSELNPFSKINFSILYIRSIQLSISSNVCCDFLSLAS